MAFWDFLKDANTEKRVFNKTLSFLDRTVSPDRLTKPVINKGLSFLSPEQQNNSVVKKIKEFNNGDPILKRARDLAIPAARAVAKTPETILRSVGEATVRTGAALQGKTYEQALENIPKPLADFTKTGQVNDPIRKFFYGSEPVETYQKRREGYQKVVGESRFKNYASPLSFAGLGLAVGGDVSGFSGEEKAGQTIIEKLAKETTENGVKNILKDKVAPEIIGKISGAVAKTKDPNIIKNIIAKAESSMPPPQVIVRGPLESKELIDLAQRGKIQKTVDYAPINSLKLGSDVVGGYEEKQVSKYVQDIRAGKTIDPIIIDSDGFVQDGKHRLAAMRQLGVKDIPVVEQISNKVERVAKSTGPEGEVIDGYAQYLKQIDDGAKGGQMIPDGQGGYIRTSEHSPFYRQYYAENGRRPSQAAYKEHAIAELKAGRADSAFQPYYDEATNPEVQSLLKQNPEKPLTSAEQNALSAKQLSQDANAAKVSTSSGITPIEPTGRSAKRGFVETVKRSDTMQPEATKVAETISQTRKTLGNPEVYTYAKNLVETNYDEALARVNSNSLDTLAEDNVIGQLLIQKALKESRTEDASRIMDTLTNKFTKAGQGSQVAALWARLSPEGILKIANQKIRKAREAIKGGSKVAEEGKVASGIKNEVENAVKIDKGDIEDTLKQIIRDVDGEEKTVAEKVAKRVENAVTPQKKKKIDTLVEELTRKIKQEQLAPLPATRKKSPTDILKEVFARTGEAEKAYPEVKQILRDRFSDNPAVLKELDKFFGSELGLPPASSTINSAIKEQLLKKGSRVREIIYQSWSGQKQSVDDIAKALTAEGFDEKSAKSLAEEVVTRLNKQLGEAKSSVLKQMVEGIPKSAQASFLGKIEKLSNLGALDDADYIDLARSKLNLPTLTPEITKDISTMAQKMQDMPDGPEKNKIIADIMNRINDAIPVTKGEKFEAYRYQNILSGPRSQARNTVSNLFNTMITRPATMAVKASTDWVGASLKGTERTAYLKDVPEYYRGMLNSTQDAIESMKGAWRGEVAIQNPDLANLKAYRLNQLPKKYTVITRAMEAQDRFFQTLISSGEYAVQKSKGIADDIAKTEAENVAKYSLFRSPTDSKNLTGQGALLSKIDQFTEATQRTIAKVPALRWFAPFVATPMNITKQFIEFSPAGFSTLYKAGGDKKAEQAAKALIGTTVTLIAAKHAADGNTTWAVPKNEKEREAFYASGKKPYSIKIGDRWVPMISFGPFAYALALPASIKDANDRAPLDASQIDKLTAVLTGQAKFFSGQTYVQGVSDFVDVISGNSEGNAQTALAGILGQAIPLKGLLTWISTTVDPVYRKKNTFVDEFRAGTPFASKKLEAYKDPDTGEDSRRNITDYVLPYSQGISKGTTPERKQKDAVAEFYKIQSKSSRARSAANDGINAAIKSGDTAKARQIAQDYNQKYADSFKDWAAKYKDNTNSELLKEYKSRKILLSSSRIKSRRRTIKKNISQRSIYSATRGEL